MGSPTSRSRIIILIFVVALAARLVVAIAVRPQNGWQGVGYGSELGQIAANVSQGRGFSSPFSSGSEPTAWLAPLVPLVWAAVFRIHGVLTASSMSCIYALQALIGAITCVAYALIARKLPALTGCASRWGWIVTALLLALWPASLLQGTVLWYFVWQELGTALLFLLLICNLESRGTRWVIAAGVLGSAVAHINPIPLAFLFAACLLDVVCVKECRRRTIGSTVAAVAIIALMCIPWSVRNTVAMGRFVPMRSSLGVELRQGNNPDGAIVQTRDSLHPALREEERQSFRARRAATGRA